MLVVDDGSPDGTGEIADASPSEHDWVEVLHRTEKNGIGPAYLAGFRHALDARRRLCDGDGLRLLPRSRRPRPPARGGRTRGADLALGSRYVPGGGVTDWGLLRRFISEGGSTYARLVLGLRVRDLTGGFKCFRREVLEAIHFDGVRSQGYAFQVELTYRAVRAGFQRRRGADRLPRPPARPEQDVLADRRRGDVARAAPALQVARLAGRCRGDGCHRLRVRPRRAPHARDAARLAARTGRRARSLGRRLGRWPPSACWSRCWSSPRSTRAISRSSRCSRRSRSATAETCSHVLRSNMLVLALHAMACVAGFIAGSSLPLQAEHHHGLSRWVHEHGGRIAIAFVACRDDLLAERAGLSDRAHASRACRTSSASRPRCCCSACCRTRSPS